MICADIVGERSRLSPERTAIVDVGTGQRLTYREMNHRASTCARAWLYGLGLKSGDRLGFLSGNRLEFIDAYFAAGKSGIILVPLGTRLTAPELAVIAGDAGLSALVYSTEHVETVRELAAATQVGRLVALDDKASAMDLGWEEVVQSIGDGDFVPQVCQPEDPFSLLYTSGTTGRPKGVVIPHRMVAWNAYNTVVCWQLTEDDVSSIFTPLYHAGGLGAFLMPIMLAGGTIVLHHSFDTGEVWRTIEAESCTVVLGVPTIWRMLADAPAFATTDLSHVRCLFSGGAPLPRHLIDIYRERGVVMRQGYGLTEVGVNCFAMSDEEAWTKAGSIGRPLMFTEAKVIDEGGQALGPDRVGELCFRGPHVSAGYWNNPQATAESRDAEGWFHTGDMARYDADGFFFIAGRAKDMFISGGVNVYPAEIENILLQHASLADAAVVGVPHEKWGEVGVAFIVLAEGETADPEELTGYLGGKVARYKIPREFRFVDQLPRTPYGKVVKGELVKRWHEENSASKK
jgi:fatty-acyl-CoA synthase